MGQGSTGAESPVRDPEAMLRRFRRWRVSLWTAFLAVLALSASSVHIPAIAAFIIEWPFALGGVIAGWMLVAVCAVWYADRRGHALVRRMSEMDDPRVLSALTAALRWSERAGWPGIEVALTRQLARITPAQAASLDERRRSLLRGELGARRRALPDRFADRDADIVAATRR